MAAFHKLRFGGVAAGSQERLDFFYRQPEASFKLHPQRSSRALSAPDPRHIACYLKNRFHWTIQQSPFTGYGHELLARPTACEILRGHRGLLTSLGRNDRADFAEAFRGGLGPPTIVCSKAPLSLKIATAPAPGGALIWA
jgi:hypothetical protein